MNNKNIPIFAQIENNDMQNIQLQDYIHSDAAILLGKPVVKGTRISVELILELLASGWEKAQILQSYPNLTEDSLRAVSLFVTRSNSRSSSGQ
jgi:uncharacterized protein (DUF433 family)